MARERRPGYLDERSAQIEQILIIRICSETI